MSKKGGKSMDQQLQDAWQPPFSTRPDGSRILVSRPTVFMDNEGIVFAWYLPGIFTSRRSVSVPIPVPRSFWAQRSHLQELVFEYVRRAGCETKSVLSVTKASNDNWRNGAEAVGVISAALRSRPPDHEPLYEGIHAVAGHQLMLANLIVRLTPC